MTSIQALEQLIAKWRTNLPYGDNYAIARCACADDLEALLPSLALPEPEKARKVTDEELAPFMKVMEEEVIPNIVEDVRKRAVSAAAARGKVIMKGPPQTNEELRIALESTETLLAAWQKRAYEAEAQLAALPASPPEKALRDALHKLRSECSGILALADRELREAVGHTNVAVFRQRIAEAEAALAASSDPSPAQAEKEKALRSFEQHWPTTDQPTDKDVSAASRAQEKPK